jgi:elongation factor G
LLEPAVEVAIECPSVSLSAVVADLGGRAVDIRELTAGIEVAVVRGRARLASMLGYATRLRSITKGLGVASLATIGLVPRDADPDHPTPPREKDLRSLDRGEGRR